MIRDTFTFKSKRASGFGIELSEPLLISQPMPRVTTLTVPGRNGDLHVYDGSYGNRLITAECFILSYTANKDISAINSWLLSEPGYHRFEDPFDEEHFMMARCLNGVERQARGDILIPFELEFDAKPGRYLYSGAKAVTMRGAGTLTLTNPTAFPARPRLNISGTGTATVEIGEAKLSISDLYILTYDSEADNAYVEDIGQNHDMNHVISTVGELLLMPGENTVYVEGDDVDYFSIVPRWWEL